MNLHDALRVLDSTPAAADRPVCGIGCDSQKIRPGEIFVAIPGTKRDGHSYIEEARERGACLIVGEAPLTAEDYVCVPSARRALAQLADRWEEEPASRLTLTGVTGTNGKTTTAWLLRHILRCEGHKTGLIGTVADYIDETPLPAERTTPDALTLRHLLRQMADGGCTHAVMEVSSHALALERVYGLTYRVGIFTNLTRDHLDFHGTMEAYGQAKSRLFACCDRAAANSDDPAWRSVLGTFPDMPLCYGIESGDLRAADVELRPDGAAFEARFGGQSVPVFLPIPGRFSVYNALAAVAGGYLLGIPMERSAAALQSCGGVPGRMEVVPTPPGRGTVLIDYAHTPDALENALRTVRQFTAGRVIAVFGCGGERDRTKRPMMGAIAARMADFSVVTDDNPRGEDPEEILQEITAGMDGGRYEVTEDRRQAIFRALAMLEADDTVLLCGKGHETWQETGGVKRPMDERKIVTEYYQNE